MRVDFGCEALFKYTYIFLPPNIADAVFSFQPEITPKKSDVFVEEIIHIEYAYSARAIFQGFHPDLNVPILFNAVGLDAERVLVYLNQLVISQETQSKLIHLSDISAED